MPETLRTFIAIPVPVPVVDFLARIQNRLKLPGMNVRWVSAGNVHLTLKFLGDIDPARIAAIAGQMDAAAATARPFVLQAGGVGVFPNLHQARVLWVGLKGDIDALMNLQAHLDQVLTTVGCKAEKRRFRAHLTIGRPRRRLPVDAVREALAVLEKSVSETFSVDRLVLFQSTLKPTGAVYSQLHTSPLGASCDSCLSGNHPI